MQEREFEMKRGGPNSGTVKVYAENYTSINELAAVTRAREKKPTGDFTTHDYFNEEWPRGTKKGKWYGFKGKTEFNSFIANGVENAALISDVARYTGKAEVREQDRLVRRVYDVAGGCVDVPRWLTGTPECMMRFEKAKVRSRIVNIGIETEVIGGISAYQYRTAGMVLAKTIAKLEKAGYRIGIRAMTGFYAWGDTIILMSAIIKKEYSPMNYARMMFPLTEVAFDRGVGWGWAARNPHYGGTIGTYVSDAFDGNTTAKMEEMYERAAGLRDFIVFTHKDMINVLDRDGEDGLMRYIETRIKE